MTRRPLAHLPDLCGESVGAVRARTRGMIPRDGLRCWLCQGSRFHQWGSSLRCDKCRIYYLSSPELHPVDFPRSCCECGGRSLYILPHASICARCSEVWSYCSPPVEYVHIVAAASVVSDLIARSVIGPSGTPIVPRPDPMDTRAKMRRDAELVSKGLNPNIDYRRSEVVRQNSKAIDK